MIPDSHRPYAAAAERYSATEYRRVGTSGLHLRKNGFGHEIFIHCADLPNQRS